MKKLIFNPWTFGAFVIFAVLLGISLKNTGQKAQITRDQLKQLETETQALETSVASKAAEASRSAKPFIKEKIARDELLWIKPGEVVMELPAISVAPVQANLSPTLTPREVWKQLLAW